MKTLLITISLFIAISSCAKKEEKDSTGEDSTVNGFFVATGNNGTILKSSNGINWTSITSGTSENLRAGTYGGSTYVVVGYSGTILTSKDSNSWTSRTSGTTDNLTNLAYGNNTFLAIGTSGTILKSTDGMTWNSQTSGTTNSFMELPMRKTHG